jgi:hypothetical protein
LCSGIFKGKFHAHLLKLVNDLAPILVQSVHFFTSGFGKTSYHQDLGKLLEGKGYQVISDLPGKAGTPMALSRYSAE